MESVFYKGAFTLKDNDQVLLFNPYLMTSAQIPLIGNDRQASILSAEKDLISQNVLIDDASIADYNSLSDFFVNQSSTAVDTLTFTDALSYQCNFKCVYCMQQNTYRDILPLSAEDKVAMWQEVMQAYGARNLSLTLFGGEPFYDVPYVQKLLSLAAEKEIPIGYIGAVTNGSIVTPEVIDLINQYNIVNLQITLDGPKEIHNARRVTKSGEDGYSLILNNMDKLLSETDVRIIINTVLDKQNIIHYHRMLEELVERFEPYIKGDNPRIFFNVGNECHPYKQSEYTQNNILREKEQDMYFKSIMDVVDLGACVFSPFPTPRCIATSVNEFVFAPNGDLYRCISGLGNKEFLVAKYSEYINDISKLVVRQGMLKRPERTSACKTCQNYSLCNGGCHYNMIVEQKSTACQNLVFRETLDDYVRLTAKIEEIAPQVFRKKN